MRFAVIGTFWLCENMIKALIDTDGVEYYAQYSRSLEKAKDFSNKFGGAKLNDNLQTLATDNTVDDVYIASPNALHYEQAKLMLENGKHVIVEKPATVTKEEFDELCLIADKNNLVVMEAMMNAHVPHLHKLKEIINNNVVTARFDFCQRSSKVDRIMSGEKGISTFSNVTYGGALADLGVYGISLAINLFGVPEKYCANAHFIEQSDVDVSATVILEYKNFDVVMSVSKLAESKIRSEIICNDCNITMDNLSRLDNLKISSLDGGVEVLSVYTEFDISFGYEINDFLKYTQNICDKEYLHNRFVTIKTVQLLNEIRNKVYNK